MKFKERHPTIEAVQFDGSQACVQDFEPLIPGFKGYGIERINGVGSKLSLHGSACFTILTRYDWLVDDGHALFVMSNEEFRAKYQPA